MDGPLCEIRLCPVRPPTSLSLALAVFSLTWFPAAAQSGFYTGAFCIPTLFTQKAAGTLLILSRGSDFKVGDVFYLFFYRCNFPTLIRTLICSSYNKMGIVPSPSLSRSLSYCRSATNLNFCSYTFSASWGVDKISVRKPSEESLKKRLMGEGKCSHTNTNPHINTYIL